MRLSAEEKFIAVILGVLALMLAVTFGYAAIQAATQSECLSLGYRDADVTPGLSRYCVTRSDQTDVVVPLERARREPR